MCAAHPLDLGLELLGCMLWQARVELVFARSVVAELGGADLRRTRAAVSPRVRKQGLSSRTVSASNYCQPAVERMQVPNCDPFLHPCNDIRHELRCPCERGVGQGRTILLLELGYFWVYSGGALACTAFMTILARLIVARSPSNSNSWKPSIRVPKPSAKGLTSSCDIDHSA